jgi:hypothetical protein
LPEDKRYEVLTTNFMGGKQGDVLTEDELAGYNVDALIKGGHLAPRTPAATRPYGEHAGANKETE